MKITSTSLAFIILITNQLIFADFTIRQSNNGDVGSAIAYNSTDHEYLVVWSENIKLGMFYTIGPVIGQRISENGNAVGNEFTVFTLGTSPKVTYNSKTNEYLAVCSYNGIQGQRVTNTGGLNGSPVLLLLNGAWPQIEYNSIYGDYLLAAANLVETPPASQYYNIQITTMRVTANCQQIGLINDVEDAPFGISEIGESRFSLAYAPIQSAETPKGRYLLAVQTNAGINLTMLDTDGLPIDVKYDPQSHQYYRYIPFQEGSAVGGEFSVDVAFGMNAGYNLPGPAFFLVWGDDNNTWDGQEWSGIYGSFIDPYKLDYLTTDPVQDNSFPISAIYDHFAFGTDEYAKSWRPKVAYNNAGQKFMVTWRETPTTNSQNDTKVNHVRADREYTGGSYYTPNAVISAISGNENPKEPAIAASTINPTALITWDDYRNFSTTDWDIYANLYTIPSVPSITVTKPNGGEHWFIDTEYEITWTSSSYSNPVRIEYSKDGGATYIEIINSIPNDGSYMWIVPFTLSDYCVVRISDATDSDPFDISDQVFSITTTNKIVTDTSDSGLGSLRQAIIDANNTPGYDTIIFKISGTGVHTIQPASSLPIITDPVLIDGFSQPGSSPNTNPISQGCNAYLNIELDGTFAGSSANGLNIEAGNTTIRGLVINNFSHGIDITLYGNNVIEGNFIGTSASGTAAKPNSIGIYMSSDSNLVGGISSNSRNIISGNYNIGIWLAGNMNSIKGNFIGSDIIGLNSIGNQFGITVANNYYDVAENQIGGATGEERNVISGNSTGIRISAAIKTAIEGNFIGTDVSGNSALPNNCGIYLIETSLHIIGGTTQGSGNLISGNTGSGIEIFYADNVKIEGNFIGTQEDGISPLGNGSDGILITNTANDNLVGGLNSGSANIIAYNDSNGIHIDRLHPQLEPCQRNRIISNSIHDNGKLGINLSPEYDDGVTMNDLGDTDIGCNNFQNFPVLIKVEVDIGTYITGSLNSIPNTTFRIDFYSSSVGDPSGYGEGQTPIGWTEVTTDANGDVDFYISMGVIPPAGYVITSTATDPNGNTSEFSNWIKTPAPTTFIVANTNDSGQGSLWQAIIDANNNPGLDSIAFNIPGTGPFTIQPNTKLPTITDPVIIDGYSQTGSHPNTYPISEGCNATIMIELSGQAIPPGLQNSQGLIITSGSSIVRGLTVNKFVDGIVVYGGGGNIIEGNYIGTDITGSTSLGNYQGGVTISSSYNMIGGKNPQSRNVISGNYRGILFYSSVNNSVQGNYIGTDASGMLYLANDYGIGIVNAQSCLIGGLEDGAENIISSNTHWGLVIDNSSYNTIQKNTIGLDRTGKVKMGNEVGVELLKNCNGNYILSNKIGGNSINGITIGDSSKYNVIADNFIGTDENWQYNLGNHSFGIQICSNSASRADGYNSIENNSIAFNSANGVRIEYSKYNTISRNLISKNGGKGIENDFGGNNDLSPPVINSVSSTEVIGSAGTGYHIEIFSDDDDEGRYYLGSATADGSGTFTFTLTEPIPLQHITATCTDLEGNTSEYSASFIVTGIEDEKNKIPTEYSLYQNFPNPFNPTTTITFAIPLLSERTPSEGRDERGGLVVLKVYDVLGNEVKTLINKEMEAGYHSIDFNASDLPSGVYFYQLKVGDYIQSCKMVLIK